MDNSEQLEKVISLGKLLVKELGLEPGVDTLARWMAHYLADRIHAAETLPNGNEKLRAQQECCETILKIWDHRNQLPRGRRPFEKFEPILKVLECLDPDKDEPYFYHMSKHELSELEHTNPNYKDIKDYIDAVINVDKVARIWIENLLSQAAATVVDEKTKEWLHAASQLSYADDIRAIRIVYKNSDDDSDPEDSLAQEIEQLQTRVEQLRTFARFNDKLIKTYQDQLTRRQKSN